MTSRSEVDYNGRKSGVPENNGNKGKHPERDRSSYERSIVRRGDNGGAYEVGTKTRVNKNEGETYRVRTRSELTRVVSEQVLTMSDGLPAFAMAPGVEDDVLVHIQGLVSKTDSVLLGHSRS